MGRTPVRKLKIAFVLDRYHPQGRGEGYFSWLIQELLRQGHEIHVFAGVIDEDTDGLCNLHKIPVVRHPKTMMISSFLIGSALAIKREEFDVIHGVGRSLNMNVFNPHGGVEKAYLKQEFRSIDRVSYRAYKKFRRYLSPQHYLKLWIQKRQCMGCGVQKIIAISRMVKKDIMDYYHVPEAKIAVVLNCVDLERFQPENQATYRAAKRRDLGIDEKTITLLFAGNNYRLKGLEPLLRAVALLQKRSLQGRLRLLVIGRGQVNRFARIAQRLGISACTSFLGAVRGMEAFYAAADIYVQPTFYDPCSLTVLEALASGLPTVTTRFNGAADVMTSDKGGQVIDDPTDTEELARSIAQFFDKDRRSEAQVVARAWMENYPPARHIEDVLRVYYEVAGQA
jgi:UDP-glucose:(heptosyl)LPS alpha-1,3-glucosyltransferase